ncbi:Lrp/AsnC family transcriptional regulator [Paenibacillus whitsoniae]|uniref:Lrp/AsnC family transcriptional regulator n=1 Tax=Paenibacillus whitsoniae TaxID=2496558 RepID=A0A430J4V7_9BACL|nr:Lrp/AsnC family transcriptional regulator [Paenibacillus whitsoniae]RTE01757.1 Lrp/AsnC family transcriptional regulator [Paenibacillus whitsoniae]
MQTPLFDDIDYRILRCLLQDAKQSFKKIGQQVHLTGQAVGARVRRLEDLGVIRGYTVNWDPDKLGLPVHAFIVVFVNSNSAHSAFLAYIAGSEPVQEAHRVSGEGCYWLRVRLAASTDLNVLLDELLAFGNYKVSLSIGQVK